MLKWSASIGRTVDSESDTLESYSFPLSFEPGEGWMYGVGLNWVGHTIEALCNCSLEEYMQEHIFKPLGMSSTTLVISKHPKLISRRAVIGFRASPRGLLAAGGDPAPQDPAMISGGSGLFCTANDYATLLGSLISNDWKLLKEESLRELCTPQLSEPSHLQAFFDGPFHDVAGPEYPRMLPVNYALGGAVNLEDVPQKRRKGSMMWSGLTNPRWASLIRASRLNGPIADSRTYSGSSRDRYRSSHNGSGVTDGRCSGG